MIVSIIVIGLFILIFLAYYNGLIQSKNRVAYAESGIETILKRRNDLIPNLVACAKEYMNFEQDTLTKIVNLRNSGTNNVLQKDEESTTVLKSVMVHAESYPDLKSSSNFIQIQQSLNEVEEELAAARRTYNAHVLIFNNKIETIPSNFMAQLMSLEKLPLFTIEVSEKNTPDVKELFKK